MKKLNEKLELAGIVVAEMFLVFHLVVIAIQFK